MSFAVFSDPRAGQGGRVLVKIDESCTADDLEALADRLKECARHMRTAPSWLGDLPGFEAWKRDRKEST